MIYLDYQATTPLAPEAREAMLRWLGDEGDSFANPSSTHKAGRAAAAAVEVARDQVAALLPKGGRVFFTSGATEAASTLLTPNYMMGRSPVRLSHLYVSATEHPCMTAGGQFAADSITTLPVDANGILRLDVLEQAEHQGKLADRLASGDFHRRSCDALRSAGDLDLDWPLAAIAFDLQFDRGLPAGF